MNGSGNAIAYKFLGKNIGPKCLATLLGVGTARLRKTTASTPDLRHGKVKTGSRQETYSVDSFLTTMYDQVAETLPDRCPSGEIVFTFSRIKGVKTGFAMHYCMLTLC